MPKVLERSRVRAESYWWHAADLLGWTTSNLAAAGFRLQRESACMYIAYFTTVRVPVRTCKFVYRPYRNYNYVSTYIYACNYNQRGMRAKMTRRFSRTYRWKGAHALSRIDGYSTSNWVLEPSRLMDMLYVIT